MKHISIPAATLSLLMAVSPFAAFADEGSSDANVSVSASAQVRAEDSNKGAGEKVREGLRGIFTGPLFKMRDDAKMHQGSSSEDRMGSTSQKRIENLDDRGGIRTKVNEGASANIDARIVKLNDVLTRLNGVERLSAEMKASLTTAINAQIKMLQDLKVQIAANATTTIKDGMNATNHPFRAVALILPKAAITAAADRIMTISGQMEALSVKIDARVDAAATAGADVSVARTALTDFNAKVADAKVQAQAAVSLVANVSADKEADQATFDANVAALKSAKAKIDAAQADLKAARADVATILKSIKGKGEVKVDVSAAAQ